MPGFRPQHNNHRNTGNSAVPAYLAQELHQLLGLSLVNEISWEDVGQKQWGKMGWKEEKVSGSHGFLLSS